MALIWNIHIMYSFAICIVYRVGILVYFACAYISMYRISYSLIAEILADVVIVVVVTVVRTHL